MANCCSYLKIPLVIARCSLGKIIIIRERVNYSRYTYEDEGNYYVFIYVLFSLSKLYVYCGNNKL